jgi:DNA recombination protein RmuC
MPAIGYLLIGVALGVLIGLVIAFLRRPAGQTLDLAGLEQRLGESFSGTKADMAERVEKMKGDLRVDLAEKIQGSTSALRDTLEQQLGAGRNEQASRLSDAVKALENRFLELKTTTDSRLNSLSEKQEAALLQSRTELTGSLRTLGERNERQLSELKTAVEAKLTQLQQDNAAKLEQMRQTVDEKLQGTLEKRLGESFKLVSDRLEQVHKGLGEMQSLAVGVGDLKKVLTNVKTRGTWGEMQLANLLEQVLTSDQFSRNVATRPGSSERVEFAIRLPGRGTDQDKPVWLPIDAKFPKEDYERLVAASDQADSAALELAAGQLETRVRQEARSIRDKYLEPPHTTDFAILYLPVEGLYAEVLRRPGLVDSLQRDFRVTVAGPTVLSALLNSLQMGFRTLAIEKRSSEVWAVLGAVKTEFGKFGEVIDKVQKKLQEASNVIDSASVRSRAIEKKLRVVQEIPQGEARLLLSDPDFPLPDDTEGNQPD